MAADRSYRLLVVAVGLLSIGTTGFYSIDGMIDKDASGSRLINSFYCATITLTTVGYGDICPAEMSTFGRLFIIILLLCGLGFFCGPVMDYSSSWKERIQGGAVGPALFALVFGTLLFQEVIEDINDWHTALYFTLITATTVGYGDISPNTDLEDCPLHYSINVIGGVLEPAKTYLSQLCMVEKVEKKIQSISKPDDSNAERKKKTKNRRKKNRRKKKQQ